MELGDLPMVAAAVAPPPDGLFNRLMRRSHNNFAYRNCLMYTFRFLERNMSLFDPPLFFSLLVDAAAAAAVAPPLDDDDDKKKPPELLWPGRAVSAIGSSGETEKEAKKEDDPHVTTPLFRFDAVDELWLRR